MSGDFEFSISEGGRLFAERIEPKPVIIVEFTNGSWAPYKGVLGTIWDSRPISKEAAMALTLGVMPE